MDRNYFLSYGQIAFLLLLSAIGKLNARIVSGTVGKSELLHYTDINDSDLYPYLSDIFSPGLVSSGVREAYHHTNNNGDHHTVFKHSLQSDFPIANNNDYFLLSMKNLKSIAIWYKWRMLSIAMYRNLLGGLKQVKRFYINPIKLVDGFKFIIKIPDKLTISSIK